MINFNITFLYIEVYVIFITLLSFIVYGYDKYKALKNKKNISRISEKSLLLLSLIGGTFGAISAMMVFRHKIKKLSFMLKFFVVLLIQIVLVYGYYHLSI